MSQGIERAVETNQRHLIKKILARYPSQWTFFRELVQNADDACAKNVTIEFETVKETRMVKKTVVSNDGNLFSTEDWNRLTSIASGNPAVDKIGFFGVGFYCVFSLSDNPTVSSGTKKLEFFWKGNSLYTREHSQTQVDAWTRFHLPVQDLENSSPPPEFDEIGGFLAELLCFTRHIRSVKVLCDGELQVSALRADEFSIPMTFPSGLTHEGEDSLVGLFNRTLGRGAPIKFLAKKNGASVSRTKLTMIRHLSDSRSEESSIVFLRAQAVFHTQLSEFNARAYMDMTQKAHPPTVTLSMLTTLERKKKQDSSDPSPTESLFLYNKLSPLGAKGRVFVGFVTSQTLGSSVHVAGPFVPTMERENLDFATPIARDWNMALSYTVGILARVLHETICAKPETFHFEKPIPAKQDKIVKVEKEEKKGFSFFGAIKKATSMFTAFAQETGLVEIDEEQIDDDALLSSLEEKTGQIVVTSMAIFAPMFSECRPYAGVGPCVWKGFLAKEFEDGPLVFTSQGRALSSDKCRLFPLPNADLPQLSTIETFAVIPVSISRVRPVGYRNIAGLASSFVNRLKEDNQICPFDLSDIVSELQKRPLRGLQETLAFVEWFFKPVHVQMVTVRCGNCGAQTKIHSTTTEFMCPSCRFRLVYHDNSTHGQHPVSTREAQLRQTLRTSVQCLLEDNTAYRLGAWKYKLDSKLEPHLDLIRKVLPKESFEQICPFEITKRASIDLDLKLFSLKELLSMFFGINSGKPVPNDVVESAWQLLVLVAKNFAASDREAVAYLTDAPCVPTLSGVFGIPKHVYTAEMGDTHNEQVQVLGPVPLSIVKIDVNLNRMLRKFLVNELGCRESLSPTVMVNAFLKGNLPRQELWRFIRDRVIDGKDKLENGSIQALAKATCVGKAVFEDGKWTASNDSFVPSNLFAPSQTLMDLNDEEVPVVFVEDDDPQVLVSFMQKYLGLKGTTPPRDLLLRIASSEKRSMVTRLRALALMVQNEDPSFDFSKLSQPIVPCKDGTWASPSGCFLEVPSFLTSNQGDVNSSKLKVCALESVGLAKRLGVQPLPPIRFCVEHLDRISHKQTRNEIDFGTIVEVLDHLALRQLGDLSESDFVRLSQMNLIPIPSTCILRDRSPDLYAQPRVCFFESNQPAEESAELKVLFCFIPNTLANKSPKHRTLLQGMGVRDAPTLSELAAQLASGAKETLARIGRDNYLNLLRSIASDLAKVKPAVRVEMSTNPCLLGRSFVSIHGSSEDKEEWGLFIPGEICIEDDSRYRRLFRSVPSCPCEPSLEQMYLRLGSAPISQIVQETCTVNMDFIGFSNEAQMMERRLCERIPVLIQRIPQDELNTDKVRPWVEAAAKRRRSGFDRASNSDSLVWSVPNVSCELKLTIRKKVQTRQVTMTACILNKRLFITKQIDFFHVASALVGEFLKVRSNDRALLWATLLQSTDHSLEEMGFVLPKDPIVPSSSTSVKRRLREDDTGSDEEEVDLKSKTKPTFSTTVSSVPNLAANSNNNSQVVKKEAAEKDTESIVPTKPPSLPPTVPSMLPVPKLPSVIPCGHSNGKCTSGQCKIAPSDAGSKSGGGNHSNNNSSVSIISSFLGGNNTNNGLTKAMKGSAGDPTRLRDNAIQTALGKCRPTDSAQGRIVSPATQSLMNEPMLDCTEPHDLVQDQGIGAIECFVQKGSTTERPFHLHVDRAREFSNLLLQLSIEVFGLDCSVIHLYWDERGTSRAFNRAGSLFFNLCCFVSDLDSIKSAATWKRWFGTMAHELSHNLHSQHDAQFANFLEMFCVEFANRLFSSMAVRGLL